MYQRGLTKTTDSGVSFEQMFELTVRGGYVRRRRIALRRRYLAVRTQRKPGGKAIIHLQVTAPGIPEPDGQVTIKVGSRSRTLTVKKGKAVGRFVGLKPGRYRVRCQYAGGTLVAGGKARDWVRIPGKA